MHGEWSEWSPWLLCNQTCNGGVQVRFRNCTNPKPLFGGKECEGGKSEAQPCSFRKCKSKISSFLFSIF